MPVLLSAPKKKVPSSRGKARVSILSVCCDAFLIFLALILAFDSKLEEKQYYLINAFAERLEMSGRHE